MVVWQEFAKVQLVKAFDWSKTVLLLGDFTDFAQEKKIPEKEDAISLLQSLEKKARELNQTAFTFSGQLQEILKHIDKAENQTLLQQRVLKSIHYFGEKLSKEIIEPLHQYIMSIQNKKGVRGFLKKADEVEQALIVKLKQIERLQFGDTAFYEGSSFFVADNSFITEKIQKKAEKGESHRESLRLYKEGKTIEEIAKERAMAVTTIESHLTSFIPSGEVVITDFLKEDELAEIKKSMDKINTTQLGPIKSAVDDKFSFGQLRMAVAYFNSR